MIYLQLLYSYLKIGFFGFGGGYAMLALIHNEIVVRHHWLTNSELTDIIAISQMTPGPIAINSATYVGYTVTGNIWGSLLATFAVSLPSLTIMLLITKFYMKLHNNRYVQDAMYGMLPMVVAIWLAPIVSLLNQPIMIPVPTNAEASRNICSEIGRPMWSSCLTAAHEYLRGENPSR